jgi:transcriptional regulator NrdR family protein
MLCPYCGEKTTVYRTEPDENTVTRYRKCLKNKYHRFVTIETIIHKMREAKTDEDGK